MKHRRFGPGRLVKQTSADGRTVYVGKWRGADGKRIARHLSSDKLVAQRLLTAHLRERDLAIGGLSREEGQDRFLSEIVPAFLAELGASRRPTYVERMKGNLDRLAEAFGPIRVRDLTPSLIMERRRRRLDGIKGKTPDKDLKPASVRTANMETNALRTCLSWAERVNLIGANPIARLKPLPNDESTWAKRRRALNEEEIGRLLRASESEDARRAERFAATKSLGLRPSDADFAARDRRPPVPQTTFLKTFIACGFRFGEAASLLWTDFDEAARLFTVRAENAKGRRSRDVPVPQYLAGDLAALRSAQAAALGRIVLATDYVFLAPRGRPWREVSAPNALDVLEQTLAVAGISKKDDRGRTLDLHALRWTCATRMLRLGVNLALVAEILGHRDPKLTMRHYTDLRASDMRSAVDALPIIASATPAVVEAVAIASGSAEVTTKRQSSGGTGAIGKMRDPRKRVARHDLEEVGTSGFEPETYGLKDVNPPLGQRTTSLDKARQTIGPSST